MTTVVGLDGGGTRSRAVVLDEAGEVQRWTLAGPGNFQVIGSDGLTALLTQLFAELDVDPRADVSLCVALAGAGRAQDQERIRDLIRQHGWARQLVTISDARAALEGALGGVAGIVVISGTGSIVLGKDHQDNEIRAGGWGPLLGDEGSGHRLAMEGLRAVFRARDGWGPPTCLEEQLLSELGLAVWDDLIAPLYSGELSRGRLAALAPVVLEAAVSGDAVALAITSQEGGSLGHQVAVVARRLGLVGSVPVACAGGVLNFAGPIWRSLRRAAAADGVTVERRRSVLPPVLGAALMAWQAAGRPISAEFLSALERTAPQIP